LRSITITVDTKEAIARMNEAVADFEESARRLGDVLHILGQDLTVSALISDRRQGSQTAEAQTPVGSCPQCGATEDKTADASTMGGARTTRCLLCGAEWESQS
jgi:formate dehydrogenase maturation protein FdhE